MTRIRTEKLSPEARKVFLWMKTLKTGYWTLALFSLKPAILVMMRNAGRGLPWWEPDFSAYEIGQSLLPPALLLLWLLMRHHFGGYMAAMILAAELSVSAIREPLLLNETGLLVLESLVICLCWSAGTCQKKLNRARRNLPRIYASIMEEIRDLKESGRHAGGMA